MITICVDFEIDSATLDLFLPIMQKNATEPLANEVSCHQFDILKDPQNPIKIFPYELYDDAVASELHDQAGIILNSINQASSKMVISESVRFLKKSIIDIGRSAAKSALTKISNFLLHSATQKGVNTKVVLRR